MFTILFFKTLTIANLLAGSGIFISGGLSLWMIMYARNKDKYGLKANKTEVEMQFTEVGNKFNRIDVSLEKKATKTELKKDIDKINLSLKHWEVDLINHEERNDEQFKYRDELQGIRDEKVDYLVNKTDEIFKILVGKNNPKEQKDGK